MMGVWRNIRLKEVLREVKKKNKDLSVTRVLSVTNSLGFVEQQKLFGRKLASKDISAYKVIERGDFAYNPARINVGSIVLLEDFDGGIISPMYAAFRCLDGLDKRFFRYWLGGHGFRVQMLASLRGSVREVLSFRGMGQMRIKLPPLEEQEKIAEILNLWDAQIAEVQDLIYHKQRLKTGLMQKLFTQSLRLKGFAESWSKVRLGDIGSTYGGLTKKTKEDFRGGNGRYITYKNIFDNSCIDVSKFEAVRIKDGERQNQVERGDIFFTISSETPEEVGMSSVLLDDVGVVFLNSFCFGYRADKSVLDSNFARFYFRGFDFRRRMYKLARGTTRFNLSKNKVMNLCIPLPPLKEQEKNAEILSVADEEIELLVQKHQALETQKRALMQRLLTGKVRV